MKRISVLVSADLMDRFSEAHAFYMRKYYPHGGGPSLAEFISLCAELALIDLEEEFAVLKEIV